jgi:hypothetical protein
VLWCYLIWYLVTVIALFDPTPQIWINSIGISVIIGFALTLSVATDKVDGRSRDHWQTFRLFMMPFGVSSFSTLIKGMGYVFIFPSDPRLLLLSVSSCGAFVVFVLVGKLYRRSRSSSAHTS